KNPSTLFDLMAWNPQHALMVVKHDIKPEQLKTKKMDGQPQAWYPKKNWSSLMVFNNSHPDCKTLTPDLINSWAASALHQFIWTDQDKIGKLPDTFNHLVGYGVEC